MSFSTRDAAFYSMAVSAALMSKDPRTQVGACLVSPDRRSLTVGYNGFPPSVPDRHDVLNREAVFEDGVLGGYGKDDLVIHAELNALLNCPVRPEGWTLYVTHKPCIHCAKHILAAGIARVVYGAGRCTTNMGVDRAVQMLLHFGVEIQNVPDWEEKDGGRE
jgi:dCMP deaminase